MKLAYLIPEHQYSFFQEAIDPLRREGLEVVVNRITADCDLILAGILPITHEWIPIILNSGIPYVLWHWDLYSFVSYDQPRWKKFLEMLSGAVEIWSCSYETARFLKERRELDSVVVPAWIVPERLGTSQEMKDQVFYAAGGNALGKRLDWAEKACSLLHYPLKVSVTQQLPEIDYLQALTRCRVYLMTAFEESNGSIPAIEAAAAGRAVVVSDIPSNREVFGDTVYYFRNDSFWDLLRQLENAWINGPLAGCSQRAIRNYGISQVVPNMANKLWRIYADLQTRTRG